MEKYSLGRDYGHVKRYSDEVPNRWRSEGFNNRSLRDKVLNSCRIKVKFSKHYLRNFFIHEKISGERFEELYLRRHTTTEEQRANDAFNPAVAELSTKVLEKMLANNESVIESEEVTEV